MECRATLPKKLGTGSSSFNGTSIYDGVFSGSAPFRPSSFTSSSSSSSRPEDYAEIFGGPRDSRRSSIPVLDVPALHDRKVSVDVRSSKLEYSNIFGGGSDALSYEDVAVDPRKMRTLSREEPNRAHTRSPSEVSFSGSEDIQMLRKASHPSLDKVKKHVSMSYNKSAGCGGKGGINGTTHIAQLHDVSGYARVVDENNPSKQLKGEKPLSNGADSGYGAGDCVVNAEDAKRSKSSMSSSGSDNQHSKDALRDRSRSNSSLFEGYEFGMRTEPSEAQGGFSPNFSPSKGNSRLKVYPSRVSDGGVGMGSPTYFDEEVDANSVAAASADAVRKAIEKAQARIKMAKELMKRRKEGFAEPKSSREQRRARKKGSKFGGTERPVEKLEVYGKMDSMKTGCENTGISDHVGQPNNVKLEQLSGDNRENNLQGEAVDWDDSEVSAVAESDETERTTLENKKGRGVMKIMQLTDDCRILTTGTTIESALGNSTISTALETIPLQETTEKTESKLCRGEAARKCDNLSDKSESITQLQNVEVYEQKLEVEGEELDSAETTACNEKKECHGNLEEFLETSSEMKLNAPQLEEENAKAEDCDREENGEKQSEGCDVEGGVGSRVNSDNEENTTSGKIDVEEENGETERESYEREQNEEERGGDNEGEGSVRSRNISDSEEENAACDKIDTREENGERRGESCERESRDESDGTSNPQESMKEYTGFGFGADAKQWLDHMKEILHVRINNLLDGKEASRLYEGSELEDNLRNEAGESEKIEETRQVEAVEEFLSSQELMVDERITIEVNMRREDEGQDAAEDGKVELCEELTETMEVSGEEENKESVSVTRDDDEDKASEEMAEVTELSVEENKIPVVESSNIGDGEAANVSVEQEDDLPSNLKEEETFGSEASDLTEASIEANGEKQGEDDASEVAGFCQSDVKLGFTGIKFGFLHSNNRYAEKPEEVCETGKHVDESDPQTDECCVDEKGADVSSDEEEEAEGMSSEGEVKIKLSDDDILADDEVAVEENQLHVVLGQEEGMVEDNQETTTSQANDREDENHPTAQTEEKEMVDGLKTGVEMERDSFRKRDDRKERERELEKEKLAVERAIREARERAFAEARERAERAAVEKATAEARRRVMAQSREKSGKTSSETLNRPADKASAEARLRAERAAVERATAEARERALEKAMSDKLSGAGKDNNARQKSSYDSQHKSSGSSSNQRNSNSSNNGVPRTTERSNGTNNESAERSKARLDRHQRTAERAAKALAEKNMRDLLAQREQAEKNRLAEALDSDIKRWSSGKVGNLRALLSTLQYILGPDSGWQPVTLTEIVTAAAVKKAYRKATLCVHPDKLQQRGASLQQKYICEKVFDLLKEAWNRFSAEEK